MQDGSEVVADLLMVQLDFFRQYHPETLPWTPWLVDDEFDEVCDLHDRHTSTMEYQEDSMYIRSQHLLHAADHTYSHV